MKHLILSGIWLVLGAVGILVGSDVMLITGIVGSIINTCTFDIIEAVKDGKIRK